MAYQNPESLKLKVIDSKLRTEAVLSDVFTSFSGIYNESQKTLPDAIMAKVPAKSGEFERTVAVRLALIGSGVSGRDQIVGSEEELRTRQLSLRANTFGNAVPTLKWGIDAELNKSVGILQEVQPALSQWHKEVTGYKIREALTQIYSSEQLKAPSGRYQGLNPNTIVSTGTGATRVTFPGTTVSAFRTNIGAAVPDGGAVADISTANFGGVDTLMALQEMADLYMVLEPSSLEGDQKLVLTLPEPIFNKLFSSASNSWTSLVKYDSKNGNVTGLKGFEYGKFIIVNDPRFPVVNITNTTNAMAWYYKTPGGADARFATKSANTTDCAVGFILGKASFWEFESAPLAFRDNVEDYQRNVGVGAFRTCGYTLGAYSNDLSNATGLVDSSGNYATGIHAKSSAMVLFPWKTY